MEQGILRHLSNESPRIVIADGSKMVRTMLDRLLKNDLPQATIVCCKEGSEVKRAFEEGPVDFVSTALSLPDVDGAKLAQHLRENYAQAYMPIVVVSGDVEQRLEDRSLGDAVTDYFDKSLGFDALTQFILGYVNPKDNIPGEILYIEDSRVVAMSTRRMLERNELSVIHDISIEDALERLSESKKQGYLPIDLILTDVTLKGDLTGLDLVRILRNDWGYRKGELPIIVMTGDDDKKQQSELLRAGANDLVEKPVEERLLITKLMFQLRVLEGVRGSGVLG